MEQKKVNKEGDLYRGEKREGRKPKNEEKTRRENS